MYKFVLVDILDGLNNKKEHPVIATIKRFLRDCQRIRLENELARQRRAHRATIRRQFAVRRQLEALGEQP